MTKNIIIAVLAVLFLVAAFYAVNYYIYYEKQGSNEGLQGGLELQLGETE